MIVGIIIFCLMVGSYFTIVGYNVIRERFFLYRIGDGQVRLRKRVDKQMLERLERELGIISQASTQPTPIVITIPDLRACRCIICQNKYHPSLYEMGEIIKASKNRIDATSF